MGWKEEHGQDFEVPGLIDYMVSLGILEDISWHNDASPAFVVKDASDEKLIFGIWVKHPVKSMREFTDAYRFLVEESDGGGTISWDLDTDDLEEAITQLLGRAEKRLPPDKRPHFDKVVKAWQKTLVG